MWTFRTFVRIVEIATLACLVVAIAMLGYHPSTHRVSATTGTGNGASAGVDGAKVFADNCTGCHGSNGQGGFAPALTGGAVVKRYPNPDDERNVVADGRDGMPPWAGSLSPEEIDAVVAYTRR